MARQHDLVGVSRRRQGPVTARRDKGSPPAPDLVDRNFTAEGPNQLWAWLANVPTAKPLE